MPVLGLAGSHDSSEKRKKKSEADPEQQVITTMQVRPAGQAGYPISLVASLGTVPVKCCVPLQLLE